MSDSKMFFGGLPPGPDVNKLAQHFDDLRHGQIIPHDELAAVIGLDHRAHRYRSIIAAWRKTLKLDEGIEMQAIRGVGLRVMSDPERVDAHVAKTSVGIRVIGRAGKDLARVPRDTLPTPVRAKADNAQMVIAKMTHELQHLKAQMLAPPVAAAPMPRLVVHNDPIATETEAAK